MRLVEDDELPRAVHLLEPERLKEHLEDAIGVGGCHHGVRQVDHDHAARSHHLSEVRPDVAQSLVALGLPHKGGEELDPLAQRPRLLTRAESLELRKEVEIGRDLASPLVAT